jgi:Tfp pilus assembly protein PilF
LLLAILLVGGALVSLLLAIAAGWLAWPATDRGAYRETIARATRYLDEDRPALALQAVRPIIDKDKNAAEALAVAGMALAALDRCAEARVELEHALKQEPMQARAHKVLAAIYLDSADYERALTHLRAAGDLEPRDARPWIARGKVYRDLGRERESADSYLVALQRDATSREARLGFVAAALKIRRPDRATTFLVAALQEAPEDPQVLGLAACYAHALGHPEQADGFAGRALAHDPANLDAHVARATSHLLAGEPQNALDDLEKSVAVNPINIEALGLLAQVESRLGLTDRAHKSFSRARSIEEHYVLFGRLTNEITQRPDDPEPRWRMGQVAAEADMLEIAAHCFRAALAIDPHCRPAREGLTALKAGKGSAASYR